MNHPGLPFPPIDRCRDLRRWVQAIRAGAAHWILLGRSPEGMQVLRSLAERLPQGCELLPLLIHETDQPALLILAVSKETVSPAELAEPLRQLAECAREVYAADLIDRDVLAIEMETEIAHEAARLLGFLLRWPVYDPAAG